MKKNRIVNNGKRSFPNKRLVTLFPCFDLLYHIKEYCKFVKTPCIGIDFKVLKAHSLKFESTVATRRSIHEQNTWPGSSLWEVLSRLDCSRFRWSRALCKLDKGQVKMLSWMAETESSLRAHALMKGMPRGWLTFRSPFHNQQLFDWKWIWTVISFNNIIWTSDLIYPSKNFILLKFLGVLIIRESNWTTQIIVRAPFLIFNTRWDYFSKRYT